MEYLMTYGWAILIIAIVMVALYSLGVFNGGSPIGTSCLAQSGFMCQTPVLHTTTFTVTLGQASGTSWATANIFWVPTGYAITAATPCPAAASNTITSGVSCGIVSTAMTSGQTLPATVVLSGTGASVGTTATGQLWAVYTTATGGPYVAQLTKGVNLKAV